MSYIQTRLSHRLPRCPQATGLKGDGGREQGLQVKRPLEAGNVGNHPPSLSGRKHFISPCKIRLRTAYTQEGRGGREAQKSIVLVRVEECVRLRGEGSEPLIISSFLDVFVLLPPSSLVCLQFLLQRTTRLESKFLSRCRRRARRSLSLPDWAFLSYSVPFFVSPKIPAAP